jgi:hypothetical protein
VDFETGTPGESPMDSLDFTVVISTIVFGLSVLATIAKFVDWFIHSHPTTMARTMRWMLMLLFAICIPILVAMIVKGQWSVAMFIATGMLIIPNALKWRTVFAPLRAAFSYFRPKPRLFDMEIWDADRDADTAADIARGPETVRRAAAILEAYVSHALEPGVADDRRHVEERDAGQMSEAEALDILGLTPGADEAAIRAAHRRLIRLVHPDHSGSTYLSRKVSQAKDTLLPGLPGSDKLLRPFSQRSRN